MQVVPARLVDPIRRYAWGSNRAIAELQGREAPTADREAELWIGAHGSSPSMVLLDEGCVRLDEVIASDPVAWLGADIVDRFGPQLPFLMKVLAAERPLSLQAHPDASRARSGFAAEESRGVPVDAMDRSYRDPWPKPELLRALSPFTALCGFRDVHETRELLSSLAVPQLTWVSEELTRGRAAVRAVVRRLLTWPEDERKALVTAVAEACRRHRDADGIFASETHWVGRLAERYGSDPGVVVALLLELVHLAPGEAVHLPPGQLHAYLEGVGIEVMAPSDNVLRGGLTEKHVDVRELLDVITCETSPVARVPVARRGPEAVYEVDEPHFRLSEISLEGSEPVRLDARGVQLLLVTSGTASVSACGTSLELASGQSAVVPAVSGPSGVSGPATVFRVTVGDAVVRSSGDDPSTVGRPASGTSSGS